jgi:hypothetical protein
LVANNSATALTAVDADALGAVVESLLAGRETKLFAKRRKCLRFGARLLLVSGEPVSD